MPFPSFSGCNPTCPRFQACVSGCYRRRQGGDPVWSFPGLNSSMQFQTAKNSPESRGRLVRLHLAGCEARTARVSDQGLKGLVRWSSHDQGVNNSLPHMQLSATVE